MNWIRGKRVQVAFQLDDDDIVVLYVFHRYSETGSVLTCDLSSSVVGPSGGGKSLVRPSSSYYGRTLIPSQFVEEVTKSDLVTASTHLKPSTSKVQAIRCELTEEAQKALGGTKQKNIVFIDTPSFHTGRNDKAAEKEMKSWLSKSE
jgi:hypothetical protein